LLGYQFSPRLADIGAARFWRTDRTADYGPLNGLARNNIDTDLIAIHLDDLLRIAGSLATGTVRASQLLRVLQGGGRPTPLGRAIAELGRIAKTLYLLAYLDDETYRRRILTQLNRTESRHALARSVFHGQRGQQRLNGQSCSVTTQTPAAGRTGHRFVTGEGRLTPDKTRAGRLLVGDQLRARYQRHRLVRRHQHRVLDVEELEAHVELP